MTEKDSDRNRQIDSMQTRNVGERERMLSGLAGGTALLAGLSRRGWARTGLLVLGAALIYRAWTGHCSVYEALDFDTYHTGTDALGRRKVPTDHAIKVSRSILVDRAPADLYRFWRNLENLPKVMTHVQSVTVVDDRRSHWIVRSLPGAPSLEWDAEIINEVQNQRIGWKSLPPSDVEHAGSVEFAPAGRGSTMVTVTMQYVPPAGRIGDAVASFLGSAPDRKITTDLHQFKRTMETQSQGVAE